MMVQICFFFFKHLSNPAELMSQNLKGAEPLGPQPKIH